MRRSSVAPLLLLAACSSGSGTAALSSPTAGLTTTPAATTGAPLPTSTATVTLSPAARRTASATAAPTPRRTPSPTPSPTRSPRPSPTRAGVTHAVDAVTGDRFSPSSLTLRSGDAVLVTDRDALAPHNFTIRSLGVSSGDMGQGDTFRYTFRAVGTFTFVCTIHEGAGMTGTLTVTR